MSYMIATPAALTAAATDIDGIGSAVSVANAAAVAATTGVLAAGGDEVLAAIARLFNANAEEYHALSAQVAAFQNPVCAHLDWGVRSLSPAPRPPMRHSCRASRGRCGAPSTPSPVR